MKNIYFQLDEEVSTTTPTEEFSTTPTWGKLPVDTSTTPTPIIQSLPHHPPSQKGKHDIGGELSTNLYTEDIHYSQEIIFDTVINSIKLSITQHPSFVTLINSLNSSPSPTKNEDNDTTGESESYSTTQSSDIASSHII